MNGGMIVIHSDSAAANQPSPNKLKILEEKRKNVPATPIGQEEIEKKNTGPLTRLSKINQLPLLEKRGGSRARVVTPPPNANEVDENTAQLSTYSRATKKIPIPEYGHQKNNPRLPGKSLPRLAGGLRKLEKMPLGKALDPLVNEKVAKNKAIQKITKDVSEKVPNNSTVFVRQFNKTLAGYSEGKTKTNQDSVYANCHVKGSNNCALFAVFDGHGMQGHKVSQFLKTNLTGNFF